MKYARLLTLSIRHSYYADGLCPDFDLAPGESSERLLANRGCVVKPAESGLTIYAPMAENGRPLIPFPNRCSLSFQLQCSNTDFPLYTSDSASATGEGVELKYAAVTVGAGGATVTVERDFNDPGQQGSDGEVLFSARSLPWIYYLVTDPGTDSQSVAMAWGDSDLSIAWKLGDSVSRDELASYLASRYPANRIQRFVSDRDIPCRQLGWAQVGLTIAGNKVFESLPNPSYRQYLRSDLDEARKGAEALFEVVNYTTNATLTKG